MRRFLIPGVVTLVAVGLLAVLAYGVSHDRHSSSIDARVARGSFPLAPSYDTALPVLASRSRLSLRDLRGKVVLLNVFASWCEPCATEAPVLAQAERLLVRHDGTVLGVTYQDDSSDDIAFARRFHVEYPILRDVTGSFASSFGTSGVPESFVISRTGRIEALSRGPITGSWVQRTLPRIVEQAS
jgi:cytochrome c biogenesis protein CcmG/thiol:disulfide interchange protein DsbE